MSLELRNIEYGRKILGPSDTGFLFCLTKQRWSRQTGKDIIKLLKKFAQQYMDEKFPDGQVNYLSSNQNEINARKNRRLNYDDREYSAPIDFIQRDSLYTNCGFIASNLADPSDFAHFMFTKLSELKTEINIPKPFRMMPVGAVCEAKANLLEKKLFPILQKYFGTTEEPIRFSLIYRGNNAVESLSQKEAKAVTRNCIWAMNPNCVQCIKYQDYAVVMHMLPPLLLVGVQKDFQRLTGYNTVSIRQGPDLTDLGEDSEDDISDDPELDEDEERQRKLRIKRKRRAEKAGLSLPEGDMKRSAESIKDEAEDEHGEDHQDEEYHQDHQENDLIDQDHQDEEEQDENNAYHDEDYDTLNGEEIKE